MQWAYYFVFGIWYFSATYALACCLVFGIFRTIYAVGMVFGAVHCESEPARAKTIEPL